MPSKRLLNKLTRALSSTRSLLVLSALLLLTFAGLFHADRELRLDAERLHNLTLGAERILNADRDATNAVRLAASMRSDRYLLNYDDFLDSKYDLLDEHINRMAGGDHL